MTNKRMQRCELFPGKASEKIRGRHCGDTWVRLASSKYRNRIKLLVRSRRSQVSHSRLTGGEGKRYGLCENGVAGSKTHTPRKQPPKVATYISPWCILPPKSVCM